ncbi:MAG: 50S ribosomal protein L13 [Chloroflexi bacterium RBG_19FT_COMBO_49_13]|nr:MAG: 50S ribosomal protein L13 [Chloroflexi bacterium RBG_19FT_COMBO_49_13]
MQKTYVPKKNEISNEWVLVDANDKYLGRLATQIASILLGKNKPNFTPGVETGDFVVVINAENIKATGNKMDDKIYYHHTGYPSGIKSVTLRQQLARHPERVIRSAVWGMLPHNSFGRSLINKMKVYAGPEHPHVGQNPKPLDQVAGKD